MQVKTILDDQQEIQVDCDVYLWIGDKGILEDHGWNLDDFVNGGKQKEWLQDRCEFFSVDDLDIHHNWRFINSEKRLHSNIIIVIGFFPEWLRRMEGCMKLKLARDGKQHRINKCNI